MKVSLAEPKHSKGRSLAVGLTSLFFILLQSACTAFMAISGLRLLIGMGALTAAAAGMKFLDALHGGTIRAANAHDGLFITIELPLSNAPAQVQPVLEKQPV